MQITICGEERNVIIKKSFKNKNTYFRVKENMNLYVTTNSLVSDKEIENLIYKNITSVEKLFLKQEKKCEGNSGFSYLGKKYDVIYVQGNSIDFGENKVFVGKELDLDKWYKKEAKRIFKEHFDICFKNFSRKIPYPDLRIRKMKSRWGVCNYKDIVVTLNLELIRRDVRWLDYVIYHELSHLIEANHSSNFWKIVEENCPDYKSIRKMMRNS